MLSSMARFHFCSTIGVSCLASFVLIYYHLIDSPTIFSSTSLVQTKNEITVTPTRVPIKNILITTLGRSGSTFLMNSFSKLSQNSYYVFEPLYNYRQIIARAPVNDTSVHQLVLDLLTPHFSCQQSPIGAAFSNNKFYCFDNSSKQHNLQYMKQNRTCPEKFNLKCPAAELRVVKSIRIAKMRDLVEQKLVYQQLLTSFPDLYLVVLLRNPIKVFISSSESIFRFPHIGNVCNLQLRMLQSAIEAANRTGSSSRMTIIKYEDFVMSSFAIMEHFSSQHLLRPLVSSAKRWILRNSQPRDALYKPGGSRYLKYMNISSKIKRFKSCLKLKQNFGVTF